MNNNFRDTKGKFTHKPEQTLKERFYSAVLYPNENGCMIWMGGKTKTGYGQISDYLKKPRAITAHRYSYALHFGVFDSSLSVLHKCDNPSCVAPDHLFLGTQKDNIKDCVLKKRNKVPRKRYGENNNFSKLTTKDVLEIKELLNKDYKIIDIAKTFGVGRQTISLIKHKRSWSNIGE